MESKSSDLGSDVMWVMVLNLRGLEDLGGLAKCRIQPVPHYHPHCITTQIWEPSKSKDLDSNTSLLLERT
jgi:hypothetical protein